MRQRMRTVAAGLVGVGVVLALATWGVAGATSTPAAGETGRAATALQR